MDNLFEPSPNFDFSKLHLGTPYNISKETFFTKFSYNGKPLFIQTPKCITRQGFIKNKKKTFCDLLFTNNDDLFINWVEKLEDKCHTILYEKSTHSNWFESKIEKSDIENTFISPLKIYKSGKFFLLKSNVKNLIKIYNEQNRILELDSIIGGETNIISILEVNGIEFTTRDFQIVFEIKQTMVVSPDPFSEECFIKTSKKNIDENSTLDTLEKSLLGENLSEIGENVSDFGLKKSVHLQNETTKIEKKEKDDITNILETLDEKQLEEIGISLDLVSSSGVNIETLQDENQEKSNINFTTKVQFTPDTLDTLDNGNDTLVINDDVPISDFEIQDLDDYDNGKNEILFDTLDTIQIKKPNDVYLERYKNAKLKAKEVKQQAIIAILEAKNIKKSFLDDTFVDSDEELETFNFSI